MLCLGIDSGTTSTRALVLDIESGKVLAHARHDHVFIDDLPHGHVEQAPQTWVDAASQAIRKCLDGIAGRKEEIVGIGVTAQQHCLVVLDARKNPIRPAKLWCDTSTAAEADELNKVFGGIDQMIERTWNVILPGYPAPKLLRLKRH